MARRTSDVTLKQRFWEKVDKTPGHGPNGQCWVWTACLQGGYGRFGMGSKLFLAHRVAYAMSRKISVFDLDSQYVCHDCDLPSCVNPDHLFLGTQKDNMSDCDRKGRHKKGDQTPQAKVSNVDIPEIKRLYATGLYTQIEVGAKYGISGSQVGRIVRGVQRNRHT